MLGRTTFGLDFVLFVMFCFVFSPWEQFASALFAKLKFGHLMMTKNINYLNSTCPK